MIKKAHILTAIFSVSIIFFAFSQKVNGGSGGFYFGGKTYDTKAYNYFTLQSNQPYEDNVITVGGGGHKIINNFMIGGYGFYRQGESRDFAFGSPLTDGLNFNDVLNGGGGYFTFGYVVYSSKKALIFPQLGFGAESFSLERSIDEGLTLDNEDFTSSEYRWASPMLDIALGFDFYPFDQPIKLGLRAGYNVTLSQDSDWRHGGGDIENINLPENDLNGFYLNLVIGGGYFEKSKP